ncbi:hypothetical protein ONS95_010142 [Cadophora gregata]|uniref:uncharacterized protein n=1 Tax=Cadophora gregata TaxID=51156 RepID=UPI0026DC4EEB|nr:uncharacterized protein ONS95_010142 [Cadophora gregata]KAK0121863.1 hypothetical protein ONS95_010142 [Cadophora gregata]
MSTLRRRTHARSRKGCVTCKERHVRCDERLPYCRNCVRLGRECSYTPHSSSPDSSVDDLGSSSGPATDIGESEITSTAYLAASHQAWLARNYPSDFEAFYSLLQQQGLSPTDVAIVRESREMMQQRSMTRDMMMTIAQHYEPKYNLLAAGFACVKHAVVGLCAFTHFRVTRSPIAEDVCIRHRGLALSALQSEIDNFGPSNGNAIVTASVFLSATADSWEEWAVYVDGYSKAITHMTSHNFPTVYPDFATDQLQLRRCSLNCNPNTPTFHKDIPRMKQNISEVNNSIFDIADLIGLPNWRLVGFEDLEKLVESVSATLCETDDTEQYHKLSGFRSWLFWIDMRRTDDSMEQVLLTAHFYGLVLAVLPVLPARYLEVLHQICVEKIQDAQGVVGDDMGGAGLGSLLGLTRAYW